MAYIPLAIDPETPLAVRALISSVEDHYFSDVHTMLRLPQANQGLTAGCNFAITQVLAAVVAGISVTLYDTQTTETGVRFKGLLRDYYPWSREPNNNVRPEEGGELIYHVFRNPLSHDLGLDLENKRKTREVVITRLANAVSGLTERQIEDLERNIGLVTLTPTLTLTPDRADLLVEAFYWGVRTMIEHLCRDNRRMRAAQTFLDSI
jgi:hypothetical protein